MLTFISLWSILSLDIIPPEDLQRQCFSSLTTTTQVLQFFFFFFFYDYNENLFSFKLRITIFCIILGGNFTRYDYGETGNLERYGTIEAPKYQMELVTAPVYLLWSKTDPVSTPRVFDLNK
jgi:hypothetical protein